MKFLRGLLYFILGLIIAGCIAILYCALNPDVTDRLAEKLYGTEDTSGLLGSESDVQAPSISDMLGMVTGKGDATATVTAPPSADTIFDTDSTVVVPAVVSGLTGYEPVFEKTQEVEDAEADSLTDTLGVGEIGDGLTFDSVMYPYYAMLDENGQTIYRQILSNANALTDSFKPITAIQVDALKKVFEAVVNDHPELFFIETGYSVKYTPAGKVVEVDLLYNRLADDLEGTTQTFKAVSGGIIAGAAGLGSDYEKEVYVHDALLDLATYDEDAELNQSAYGCLVNARTVCAGYARAFQYIMQQLGIPTYCCTGYSGEDHAWDIVKLDDGYYNVDVTWDDTDPNTKDYFNRTDEDYRGTHVRKSLSVNLPPCNATKYRAADGVTWDGTTVADPGPTETPSTIVVTEEPIAVTTPHPTPMRYDPKTPEPGYVDTTPEDAEVDASDRNSEKVRLILAELGLTSEDISWELEDYYADCKEQMVLVGSGQKTFVNYVPASLYSAIESAYGTGEYKAGYVTSAMETMGVTNFAIQLQAERLGNGYYKLYHNIATW